MYIQYKKEVKLRKKEGMLIYITSASVVTDKCKNTLNTAKLKSMYFCLFLLFFYAVKQRFYCNLISHKKGQFYEIITL